MMNTFPPGNSGGLIEAVALTHLIPPAVAAFPPGNSGGLIEALAFRRRRRLDKLVSAG